MNRKSLKVSSRQISKSGIFFRSMGDASSECVAISAGQIGPQSIDHHGQLKAPFRELAEGSNKTFANQIARAMFTGKS
ncbi:hypothetical protein SH528x_006735 [Novipirellula sp. SH528]|uniref:hypothetical protein n=1 Tax=Novipirellula sp. SH528 TaxID=3454466 RepID=UPI003FA0FE03